MLHIALLLALAQAPLADRPSSFRFDPSSSLPGPQDAQIRIREGVGRAVDAAIQDGVIPGAVVAVHSRGERVVENAWGRIGVDDALSESDGDGALRTDAIFDLASLTKVVATATSVMKLADDGRVDLAAPVARYLPEFGANGKDVITVEQLLRHRGGLIPDNALADYADGPEKAWEKICALGTREEPGTKFTYTDVGFIALGRLVEAVDGRPLDRFASEEIFEPLGMSDTGFNPPGQRLERSVPTEKRGGVWMRGEVHDPRAYALGGVAGHAGLFSTARDLTRWCDMILGLGEAEFGGKKVRILRSGTVRAMTSPRWLPKGGGGRGLGFDVDTGYSSPRGQHFPRGGSFGHTGFTGTSLWIDPSTRTSVVILTSRVHPDGKGSVSPLRRAVADAVAHELIHGHSFAWTPTTHTGVDVLEMTSCSVLAGRRVALITNTTGRTRSGRRTIDVLHEAPNVQLVRIFSPEHGLYAKLEGDVGDATDEATGLPVFSLYGDTRTPTAEMMEGIDDVVFDIQDIGVRYYTYISTLGNTMQACAEHGVRTVVLDRPNPIGGDRVEGPIVDADRLSFIGWRPLPLRHGMTVGEIAGMFREEWGGIDAELLVVKMEHWERSMHFAETGQVWVNPSPNMRNPTQAELYPCIGLLEGSNLSVGRGTDEPFERFGAPWIDGARLASMLSLADLPGVEFTAIEFVPEASKFEGERCQGVHVTLTDRDAFRPAEAGLAIVWHLNRLFPSDFDLGRADARLQNRATFEALLRAPDWRGIETSWEQPLSRFRALRERYLLY
ncbi:MAG: exo-beta-N-acetylmuramidase NamZ domain-containing protein [Planctomycetota bacterium]